MNARITALNVRLPAEIVSWLDSIVEKGIYKSRAEAIRDQIRDYVHGRAKGPRQENE